MISCVCTVHSNCRMTRTYLFPTPIDLLDIKKIQLNLDFFITELTKLHFYEIIILILQN